MSRADDLGIEKWKDNLGEETFPNFPFNLGRPRSPGQLPNRELNAQEKEFLDDSKDLVGNKNFDIASDPLEDELILTEEELMDSDFELEEPLDNNSTKENIVHLDEVDDDDLESENLVIDCSEIEFEDVDD